MTNFNIFMSLAIAAALIATPLLVPAANAQIFLNVKSANLHSDQTFTINPNQTAQNQQTPLNHCVCTQVYNPVCGVDGKTYGNECMAQCVGTPIAHKGECKAVKPTPKPVISPQRLPISIQTNVRVFQGQYVQTKHPVTIRQSGNLHMPGFNHVQANWSQHLHGSGQLTQESTIQASSFWQLPAFFWRTFSW